MEALHDPAHQVIYGAEQRGGACCWRCCRVDMSSTCEFEVLSQVREGGKRGGKERRLGLTGSAGEALLALPAVHGAALQFI